MAIPPLPRIADVGAMWGEPITSAGVAGMASYAASIDKDLQGPYYDIILAACATTVVVGFLWALFRVMKPRALISSASNRPKSG